MQNKFLAFALAAMFVVSAFAIVVDSEDSDAISAGTMNIYVYNGSAWTDYTNLSGYNALQALQSSGATFTGATIDGYISTDYIIQKSNTYGNYDEINENYGDLLTLNGVTETSTMVWNTFYYDGSDWQVGPAAIGFIVPFSDGALASANVVLYYGAVATSVPADVSTHVNSPISMINPSGEGYEYEFYLKVSSGFEPTVSNCNVTYFDESISDWDTKTLEASDLADGITVRGYGSNAYAALKNALSGNVVGTDAYGPYNGWLTTLFGLGTISVDGSYNYWSQYTGLDGYLSFSLGAYSALENVPTDLMGSSTTMSYDMSESSFKLIYV